MKKLIGLCALGLSMAFLTGCNDSGKDISGVYQASEVTFTGKIKKSKISLDKVSDGYNITLLTTNAGSDDFTNTYDWGRGILVSEFVVRKGDDEKVFEVLDDGSIKRIDIQEQTVFTKVKG